MLKKFVFAVDKWHFGIGYEALAKRGFWKKTTGNPLPDSASYGYLVIRVMTNKVLNIRLEIRETVLAKKTEKGSNLRLSWVYSRYDGLLIAFLSARGNGKMENCIWLGEGTLWYRGVCLGRQNNFILFWNLPKGFAPLEEKLKNRSMEKKRRLSIEVGPGIGVYIAWDAEEKELYVALPLLIFCFWLGKRKEVD